MRDKVGITGRPGANMGKAEQLARSLSIPGLRHLTDDEADMLVECLRYQDKQAVTRAFNDGWNAAEEYNADMRQLNMLPPTMTQH